MVMSKSDGRAVVVPGERERASSNEVLGLPAGGRDGGHEACGAVATAGKGQS